MKSLKNKKGFTLIELLVVITIIGILAAGATATYTSQIQKARDSNRITDIQALRSGVEQFYQDASEYPIGNCFGSGCDVNGIEYAGVKSYVPKLPKDPKNSQACNNKGDTTSTPRCVYSYKVNDDTNGIKNGVFETSTSFENEGNVFGKRKIDGGNDDNRFEVGLDLNILDSSCKRKFSIATTETPATNTDKEILIAGKAIKKDGICETGTTP